MAESKILCPSILNLPIEGIAEEIVKIDQSGIDIFHVDLMDGSYVPNFGMSIREIDLIRKYSALPIDCHLMVMEPGRHIHMLADHGVDIFYIHPNAQLIPTETLAQIQGMGKKAGIAINPCDSLEHIKECLWVCDYVLLMGVNPGYAGRDYLDYVTPKAKALHDYRIENKLDYHIVMDGGADDRVITLLYHQCNIEGFVIGKQEFFRPDRTYKESVDWVRSL